MIAVAGAVVSKPIAKKTTSRSGVPPRELECVERGIDHPDVRSAGLRLQQRAAAAGDAHHVTEGGEDHPRLLGQGDRVVDAAHGYDANRTARTVHEVDLGRDELLDPVLVDGVRVPTAHLHDLDRPVRLDELRELTGKLPRELTRPVLVDEPHGVATLPSAIPA